MSTNNKKHVNADDLVFDPLGESEAKIIEKARNKILFSAFKKRTIASVIVGIIVAVGEFIGRKNLHIEYTLGGTFAFIAAAVVVFNLLSYGYVVLKRRIDLYSDNSEFLYCTVAEKYSQYKLSNENKKKSHNYVILETERFYCNTAFPVNDTDEYDRISVGDRVMLVKNSPFGDVHYELFTEVE